MERLNQQGAINHGGNEVTQSNTVNGRINLKLVAASCRCVFVASMRHMKLKVQSLRFQTIGFNFSDPTLNIQTLNLKRSLFKVSSRSFQFQLLT
jgi:hypothetical protein